MQLFAQQLLLGVSLGAVYALIALGIVTIFQGTKVFNLAQGTVMLLGIYVAAKGAPHVGFLLAVVVGLVVGAVAAVVIWLLTLAARGSSHLTMTILTMGVQVILISELTRRIGSDFLTTRDPWGDRVWHLGGVGIPEARGWAIIVTLVLVGIFFWAFRATPWGAAMRAASADPVTAELLGISERRVASAAWVIGGALAVVAGVFLAASPNPGLDYTSHLAAFSAIPAVVIGGLDSSEGAVLGGLIVGLVQGLVTGYESHYAFLGSDIGSVTPYILMVVVLLVKPYGLFGSKEVARV
ncbi:branched-chain amino acid ABC transporter permease [Nocardioides sp. Kera G14]|uniref:branched-chain amino acid ABC transporter permease n=1 Tax=Nocardioides sp. Kera G14 TaxID=2884264 RepID=UPI001D102F98|nr:branched-chain amino acid ABC transporter permease [Nocardioides sp. Kera G14]UDY23675.1 branched-chain amino acid ABC transporter permease [Nocardioides sp. Kera G14]